MLSDISHDFPWVGKGKMTFIKSKPPVKCHVFNMEDVFLGEQGYFTPRDWDESGYTISACFNYQSNLL